MTNISLFEYDGNIINLSEVFIVIKLEKTPYHDSEHDYKIYFKHNEFWIGIKEKDIELFRKALRDYHSYIERCTNPKGPDISMREHPNCPGLFIEGM